MTIPSYQLGMFSICIWVFTGWPCQILWLTPSYITGWIQGELEKKNITCFLNNEITGWSINIASPSTDQTVNFWKISLYYHEIHTFKIVCAEFQTSNKNIYYTLINYTLRSSYSQNRGENSRFHLFFILFSPIYFCFY